MPVENQNVAVLLAAYNGMLWIEQQLDSIQAQSMTDVSIYISVDLSTDGTEAWCAAYAARHSNVVVLPTHGKFGGASRNFFRLIRDVDFSGHDFIAFADQDDIWHEDKLVRATRTLLDDQCDAYSSNVTAFWASGKSRLLDKAQPQVEWDYLFEAAGPGCTYVLGRRLADALKTSLLTNWPALQYVDLHDWYCYAFARSRGFRWVIDPVSTMQYRQHDRNQVGANTGIKTLIARYKTVWDGWWFKQVRIIVELIGLMDDRFIRQWIGFSRRELMFLSLSSYQCRRRKRDKALFFILCWVAALSGTKKR
ncbi:glycosyltransferase [Pseudomonas sp. AKS31]|uniref:glycosyltransferase n=1 Tax=Pseudomonas sp. AKS31 TaxID=2949091 RepID=UPI002029D638|nr:glycosyltransferase [Pseudomonas sp. AKS31]MCL9801470.1 glycosyltransferase [Pseudomonas sp. AKS31]